ncbi:MAG: TIGR00299 family protein [Syntrophus sp. (in: bacteria)]|nr:TIGR00299 family protein [Syntrophus sp. (in: bacteria)]
MKILYIDPIFGISGDMMISALIDVGLPFEEIERVLSSIPLPLPAIVPAKAQQGIIEGIHLEIGESDIHLSPGEMEGLIEGLLVEKKIKDDAKTMLDLIVEAESKVHGVPKGSVHLHELSHIDTLIDIVSVAAGIHYLGIDKVYTGPIPHGRGTIKTAHGIMPNPPPATLEILGGYKTVFLDVSLELTTPTGATIVKHYAKDPGRMPPVNIHRIGYGLGSYVTDKPDALRVFIAETASAEPLSDSEVWVIEADLDDMEAEYIGACAERMRKEGALDVLYFPVYMKKGRIGIRLSLTVPDELLDHLVDVVFSETTTFGMRLRMDGRRVLRREVKTIETNYGPVRIKYGYDGKGDCVKTHIEFEDIIHVADEKGIPYRVLLDTLKKELERPLNKLK